MKRVLNALAQLGGGLGTALMALGVVVALPVLAVTTLGPVHALARRERLRLGRRGPDVIVPEPGPRTTRRELAWLLTHATSGFVLGLAGILLPTYAVRDLLFPLYWQLIPGDEGPWWWSVSGWPDTVGVVLLGLLWTVLTFWLTPALAIGQTTPGRVLLAPEPGTDLSLRVAELTATRAGALDAHAAELRRIERTLHDGTQNRMVTVNVLLGAARRALQRDPATVDDILARAQDATEQALAELRAVSRAILPPVLADRGLAGALDGLAAGSPVPCTTDVQVPGRCAASVEATAYFVVAEALTNIAKHSGAKQAAVVVRRDGDRLRLRVTDDGRGGAAERGAAGGGGSGLVGIRRRVEAYDGTLTVSSPAGGPTVLEAELPCGS